MGLSSSGGCKSGWALRGGLGLETVRTDMRREQDREGPIHCEVKERRGLNIRAIKRKRMRDNRQPRAQGGERKGGETANGEGGENGSGGGTKPAKKEREQAVVKGRSVPESAREGRKPRRLGRRLRMDDGRLRSEGCLCASLQRLQAQARLERRANGQFPSCTLSQAKTHQESCCCRYFFIY